MERKLNISLVLGAGYSRRLLDLFGHMSDRVEVKALGLLNDISSESYLTDIPLQTFIEDQHLPGFMLGVEDDLSRADLVVASGLMDASTYQAFRYSYHNQKPFLIFCQNESELKKALLNKPEDFQDCMKNASGFLVYDEGVAETLEFIGVGPEKIFRLTPRIDVRKFGFHEKLRSRFRGYLKVATDSRLIVAELSEGQAPLQIMSAFKMLEALDTNLFSKSKLLFVGNPENKDQVKYRAVDLNLTKSILFIAQDMRPFFLDLMASSDLFISLSQPNHATDAVFSALEAMAAGANTIVDVEHPLANLLPDSKVADTTHNLPLVMRQALLQSHDRNDSILLVQENFQASEGIEEVLTFLRNAVAEKPGHIPLAGDFALAVHNLNSLAKEGLDVFEPAFERELEIWSKHGDSRGKLLLLRAQFLLSSHILDEALLAFELCTQENHVQREAFLGLGKIAFFTHSYDEALSFYRKSLALKPNDPEAMGGIGLIYRKLEMADEAVYWLGKSISVDVENSRYLNALTQACLESDDADRSISLLEQLKILLGNKPSLVMCLGQLYFKIGNTQRGKELVDLALEITQSQAPSLSA